MYFSAYNFALFPVLQLVTSTPTAANLVPRCGTTVQPSFIQQTKESDPNTIFPNTLTTTKNFHVEQDFVSGKAINRIYQVIAFTNIPANSYACTLNVKIPSSYTITTTGTPTLNVTTLYKDDQSRIIYPNDYSWNKFSPTWRPPFGQGLFGTSNFAAGQTSTINSQACPDGGGNMAFVFEVASWVWGAASVDFKQTAGAGVYLTYDC